LVAISGGTLTGKYRAAIQDKESRQQAWGGNLVKAESGDRETAILNKLDAIAQTHGAKMLDIALAWLRQKEAHTSLSTVTILGPRNITQLEDNLSSLQVTLSAEEVESLTAISNISLGSPHEIIANSQSAIFGSGSGKIIQAHPVA
jgi:aryl-alcohol dehydrogenase-like predicted oxidoreductase